MKKKLANKVFWDKQEHVGNWLERVPPKNAEIPFIEGYPFQGSIQSILQNDTSNRMARSKPHVLNWCVSKPSGTIKEESHRPEIGELKKKLFAESSYSLRISYTVCPRVSEKTHGNTEQLCFCGWGFDKKVVNPQFYTEGSLPKKHEEISCYKAMPGVGGQPIPF